MVEELLEKLKTDINLLDEQCINIEMDLKKIYPILEDLEALSSKIEDTALYSLISRDFLVIMNLYYKERDELEKEKEMIIKKRGRLAMKRAQILGQL